MSEKRTIIKAIFNTKYKILPGSNPGYTDNPDCKHEFNFTEFSNGKTIRFCNCCFESVDVTKIM